MRATRDRGYNFCGRDQRLMLDVLKLVSYANLHNEEEERYKQQNLGLFSRS
ncbi:unnamed protein product [Dovyalis caffra]|uniref:Uncharacterized protein n=1 Tax=Dovyalis caffra TaxID=77055 RepID=A0AAV1R499_9ROSI|nr:unnamed protein product [Dovyalis caffra]